MRRIVELAKNDLRLTLRDRAAFFWLLLTPLAMMWFFGHMSFSGGGPKKIALTLVDRDGGVLAGILEQELTGDRVDLTARPEPVRWLEIPVGFTENALAGRQQVLVIAAAEDADEGATRAAEVLVIRAIVRTLGRAAELAQGGTPITREAYEALRSRPPLVSLSVQSAGRGTSVPSGVAQSVPGILTFSVLMMTLIYGAVFLTIEKREGMLRRQLTLPVSRGELFAGKVLGRLFIAGLQVAVLVIAGRFLFGLGLGRSPGGLVALMASYAFAVAGIATFLGAILRTPEQASAVGWLAAMVMAAMGGCWWPAELMPSWLRTASHIFPTAWAMDAFHALISFGRPGSAVALPCAMLVGFGVVFSVWGARRLDAAIGT